MPVRIYDISKKLGLENKEVLAKAKALGIAAARVASSSLDKITAEYLEQQIVLDHPHLAQPAPASPTPVSSSQNEPVVVLAPPQTETLEKQEAQTATATALLEPEPAPQAPAGLMQAEALAEPVVEQPVVPEPAAKSPPPPPQPSGPKVGDKVGFIQLPTKPAPKAPEK